MALGSLTPADDAMVASKYAELIQEEGTDMTDKFAVQEANRRAVRGHEASPTRPAHIPACTSGAFTRRGDDCS